jgi:hypothetical protein
MARIKRYLVNGAEGDRVERYLVLFRHVGREKPAGTFDEFEAALAEKQRADRAKREGKLDDYAAGLLTEPDNRMTLGFHASVVSRGRCTTSRRGHTHQLPPGRQQVDPADRRHVAAPGV